MKKDSVLHGHRHGYHTKTRQPRRLDGWNVDNDNKISDVWFMKTVEAENNSTMKDVKASTAMTSVVLPVSVIKCIKCQK